MVRCKRSCVLATNVASSIAGTSTPNAPYNLILSYHATLLAEFHTNAAFALLQIESR